MPVYETGDRPFESSTARQSTLRSSGDQEHQAAILDAVSSNLTGESNQPAGGAPPAMQVLRSTARTAVSKTANVGSNPAGPANLGPRWRKRRAWLPSKQQDRVRVPGGAPSSLRRLAQRRERQVHILRRRGFESLSAYHLRPLSRFAARPAHRAGP